MMPSSKPITTELNPARRLLVRRLLAELARDCASTAATYWNLEENPPALRAIVNAGGPNPTKIEGLAVPLEGSLVGMVANTRMAAAMGPEAAYHPAAEAVTGTKTEAMAAAPVCLEGHVMGVLSTINPISGGIFSQEDVERVQWRALLLGCLLEHWTRG